ncbi:MAG: diguanylate cyclase [Gammaproteobacteria bacterium]|nr:diguanylate cyclase [Gammaproteobacteria bacterium]
MKQLTVTALEAVIDASGQGVMVVDVSGDERPVVFVNDELARLTGVPKSGFRNNGLDEFAGIFADTEIVADCERCLGSNSSIDMMISGVRPDGRAIYGAMHISCIETRSKKVSHVVVYVREVHDPELAGKNLASADFESAIRSDRLTGLCRRRYFERVLTREWGSAIRDKGTVALFLIRIDEFGEYSRTFGRQAADACLRQIGSAVKAVARRSSDLTGRFEDEILVAMSRNMDESQCEQLGQRFVDQVNRLCIHHPHSAVHHYVSVSVGVVNASPASGTFPLQAIEEARDALDEAIARGGRRVLTRLFHQGGSRRE